MTATFVEHNRTWLIRVVLDAGEDVRIGDEVEVEKCQHYNRQYKTSTETIAAIVGREGNVVMCAKVTKPAQSAYAFTGRRGQ
jgi:hypothetical protein